MSSVQTGGGGIHREARPIWPNSKKVNSSQQTQSTSSTSRSQPVQTAPSSTAASAAQAPAATQAAQQVATPPSRPMAVGDIVEQLLQLGVPNTTDNTRLASFMMQHGVELSGESFQEIFKLLKGRNQKSQLESAVISLAKGLQGSPQSVDMLASFFTQNQQVGQQMSQLQNAMAQLSQALITGQQLLNPGLIARLGSVIDLLSDDIKKLLKKGDKLPKLERGKLIKDFSSLGRLLGGLEKQLAAEGKFKGQSGEVLKNALKQVQEQLQRGVESLATQTILSKDTDRQLVNDRFFYWVIPNPNEKNKDIELLMRKDPKKKGEVDPDDTQIIIKLETPDLGELTIVVDIKDQKVSYIFHTQTDEIKRFIQKMQKDLVDRMAALNYKVIGFKTVRKRVDLRKYLLPTTELGDVLRISTEV